jgi:methyl-accepting chemotaxis protein
VLFAVLSVLIAIRVANPLTKISEAIEQLSTGDVTTQCDARSAISETSGIARAFHSLKDALNNSMLNVKDSANALSGAIVSVDGKTADNVEHISQINDAIGDVSQTSQVVAEDAQVIAAKSVELGEDIETLTENVTTLFNASQTIKTANDEATDCMQSVYKNGNDSVEAIRNISDKISETNEAIGKIGSAVQAIESIAAQTNLLSLNASIEAARAGEAGKGFAVVADEIRSLADSSAESAREIKQVIEDVIALSNGTVDISNKVFEVITREQEDIEKAQAKFTVLSDSVEASIHEINTIKEMTGKLDAIKDDLAKTTSELGAISEELGASAEEVSASCQVVTAACTDTQQSAVEMRNINENMSQAIDFFKL